MNVYSAVVKVYGLKYGETGKRWHVVYDDCSLNAPSDAEAVAKAVGRAKQKISGKPLLRDLHFWLEHAWEYLTGDENHKSAMKAVSVTVQKRG